MVDDEIETIHLYVVREGPNSPSKTPVIIPVLTLFFLVSLCVFIPSRQPELRKTLRIPAVFFSRTFTATEPIIATGIKTYPATTAYGVLTITNGSVIAQTFPAGLIFTGNDGMEVITDTAVFVPAGSAAGYGFATVSAHAAASGKSGNIAAYDVNRVIGSSVYIRNLLPFTGGQDAYSVTFATPQDRQAALGTAKAFLATQEARTRAIQMPPCKETVSTQNASISVLWVCRFAAWPDLPGFRIIHVGFEKDVLVAEVAFIPHHLTFPAK